jgi:hypothetical protein
MSRLASNKPVSMTCIWAVIPTTLLGFIIIFGSLYLLVSLIVTSSIFTNVASHFFLDVLSHSPHHHLSHMDSRAGSSRCSRRHTQPPRTDILRLLQSTSRAVRFFMDYLVRCGPALCLQLCTKKTQTLSRGLPQKVIARESIRSNVSNILNLLVCCRALLSLGMPVNPVHQEKPHLLIHSYKLEYARICEKSSDISCK